MKLLFYFIIFLATLLIVVLIHEYGHFYAARRLGIKTLRFSFGFGKPLWRRVGRDGTEYVFSLLPLGGYVQLLDGRERPLLESEKPYAFDTQPVWARLVILLAGPAMNLFLGWLVFSIVFIVGIQQVTPTIGEVIPHSIAAGSGLPPGAEIKMVDGQPVASWQKILMRLVERVGDADNLVLGARAAGPHADEPSALQGQQPIREFVLPLTHWRIDHLTPDPLRSLGIVPSHPPLWPMPTHQLLQFTPLTAIQEAAKEVGTLVRFNGVIFQKMFTGKISLFSMSGPIAIFQTSTLAFKQGLVVYLSFLGLLSVMLACINLLPIPGLDGGQMLFCAIEGIVRRPIALRWQQLFLRFGMIALILLMVQATINDMLRLFS